MKTKATIKDNYERKVKIMEHKPAVGKGTVRANVKVKDGFTCEFTEGDWTFTADMSEKSGGNNQGPTPGTFGRAAFGSCLAISYIMYASLMDVPIENLEVDVQVDYDARGIYGFEDVRPGYTEVRYTVKVDSPATEEELIAVMDKAEKHSSYLDVFSNTTPVKRQVEILKTNV